MCVILVLTRSCLWFAGIRDEDTSLDREFWPQTLYVNLELFPSVNIIINGAVLSRYDDTREHQAVHWISCYDLVLLSVCPAFRVPMPDGILAWLIAR